ncbi:transglutaminase domain-containing protein [Tenacibaculum sp. C7A-26P2]|uniref:transglutaminase domain-containing protein n=1 Tax=Tenacibaculum sp. C7A-26P2 TaxID=3447504 RepID=UPI003F82C4AE
MIKQFLIAIMLCFLSAKGQVNKDYRTIMAGYPKSLSAKSLAAKILKDFSTDRERSEAAFYWVANNIKYNLNVYHNLSPKIGFRYSDEEDKRRKILAIKDSIINHTLQTKTAVCEGYSQTLSAIYTHLGFENIVINGFVRNSIIDIGNIKKEVNHAWNMVKIDDEWKIVDATWAAGSVINGRWQQNYNAYYYDIPKKHYLKTHFPKNRKWKFGNKLSKEEFYDQPIYSTEFLQTNLELITPLKGVITKKESKELTLKIKNLGTVHKILYVTSTSRYAQKPEVNFNEGIGYVKIKSLRESNRLFIVINGEIHMQFKLLI